MPILVASAGMHSHTVTDVIRLAERVFGERQSAQVWLDRPSVQLGGRAPRDVIATAEGARRVEELLAQIDDDQRLHAGRR